MTFRPTHWLHIGWFSLLALAGCDCGTTPAAGCVTDRDCPDGVCVNELCAPAPIDASSSDAMGSDTGADAAVPDARNAGECTTSMECTPGQQCTVGGECLDAALPCVDDAACGGDRYCCADGCALEGDASFCIPYGSGPRGDVNPECQGLIPVGLFEPSVQCEWLAPPDGDMFAGHIQVLPTPLVADLGNIPPSDPDAIAPGEILINTYNFTDGGSESAVGINPAYFGVLRVLNAQDCSQLETIHDPEYPLIAAAPPAIGDLDGDGIPEIVALTANTGLIAFRYNPETGAHERYWVSEGSNITGALRWDGPSIHDLDDDGIPEVLSRGEVFSGVTGARINVGQTGVSTAVNTGSFAVAADFDNDGAIELVANDIFRWDTASNLWVMVYPGPGTGAVAHALADFGTPAPGGFDSTSLDGIAEIVTVLSSQVTVTTLDGTVVMTSNAISGGGPPTVGDFDNDGFPEVASAGGTEYVIFDLECEEANDECVGNFVRWSTVSQDASSARTGSSIFDFEGDGQAEALYADECFTRIYDGSNGDVLYSSFRTSCTWYENAVVADADRDENTEIIVGSNSNCSVTCPLVDPIHPGVRCEENEDCRSGACEAGLCRCEDDTQCEDDTTCTTSLDASAALVCRAVHPADVAQQGVRVLRDSLDRWVSSRPIWNQHTYSITNVNDDGTIPRTSEWAQNHADASLNNYRQNAQGEAAPGALPDITGRLDTDICREADGEETRLVSTVCNRGERAVGAALPATFYLGPPSEGVVLCTSFTPGPVPVGGCLEVSCVLGEEIENGEVYVRVNDDGAGGATTIECIDDNNEDSVTVSGCGILL